MAGGGLPYGEVTPGSPQLLADLSFKQDAIWAPLTKTVLVAGAGAKGRSRGAGGLRTGRRVWRRARFPAVPISRKLLPRPVPNTVHLVP